MRGRLAIVHPGTRQPVILGARLPAKRRREALADLLRTRRERLTPDDVGLPNIGRRRTPGLRREEVAQLAGVSAAWYTWLEQARDIRPSTDSLDSIARALRFTEVERAHAYALVGHVVASPLPPPVHEAPPLVQSVLDALTAPAYVSDRTFNVIGWNKLADSLLGYSRRTERNTFAIVFGDPAFREVFVNFADEAAQLVANLRRASDEAPDDPAYDALVARLSAYPEFKRLWARHDVRKRGSTRKELRHPELGTLTFTTQAFTMVSDASLRMVVFVPDAATAKLLRRLR